MNRGGLPNLVFRCPACRQESRLPGSAVGKPIACPGCGLRTRIPAAPQPAGSTSKRQAADQRAALMAPEPRALDFAATSQAASVINRAKHLLKSWPIALTISCGVLSLLAVLAFTFQPKPLGDGPIPVAGEPPTDNGAPVPGPDVTESADPPPPSSTVPKPHLMQLAGRSEEDLREALSPLAAEVVRLLATASDSPTGERQAALIRLAVYRRLCGVSDSALSLDPQYNIEAAAAAEACRRLGHLSHEPTNAGMPAAEFEQALRGARSSNLASGMADLVAAVDAWMDDSDADNLARLGHRRWCLNPPLQRVGFGRAERFFAMWAHDSSGPTRLEKPAICFPPPGCVPIDMFRPHYAWSVTLDPRAFQAPKPGLVRIAIRKLVDSTGPPLATDLDFLHVDTSGCGIANCVIFRPTLASVAVGGGYEVTLEGLRDHDGRHVHIRFVTRFVDPLTVPGSALGL
jgi:hypothetical protein